MHPRLRIPVAITSGSTRPILNFNRAYAATAAKSSKKAKSGSKDDKAKKKRGGGEFTQHDLKDADQFTLRDAMRYIRAMEVGQSPIGTKIRLPTPVKTDKRICVIAEGEHAEAARQAGAALVGTEEVFEQIRQGNLNFDLCIAHEDSFQALAKTKLARVLGPKGLMPSPKLGTVVRNTGSAIRDLVGKSDYKEKMGVVRLAIGQLRFTEAQLAENIKAFMKHLKKDIAELPNVTKTIHEVVLSSTHSSGFSLNGQIEPAHAGVVDGGEESKLPV